MHNETPIPAVGQARQITCLLEQGKGPALLSLLHDRGIHTANLHHARGSWLTAADAGGPTPLDFGKDIVTVIADATDADELFRMIYDFCGFDRPGVRFMYMETLRGATPYPMPG